MNQNKLAFRWRKSSYSGGEGGQCVEVASLDGVVGVRDSKAPDAGHLVVAKGELAAIVRRIKGGALDL